MAPNGEKPPADPARRRDSRADNLPLHPAIQHWLQTYAETPVEDHDRVVAEMLTDLNRWLVRSRER